MLQVLGCSKQLPVWGHLKPEDGTFFSFISKNEKVTQAMDLMATVLEGAKDSVNAYLTTFQPFAFLWQKNLATEYAAFVATNPELEVRAHPNSA